MHPLDILIASVLALTGGGLSTFAFVSSRHVRRILREKTSRVAELATGPAEIVGDLHAQTPVLTLDGSPAVAVRWAVHATYHRKSDDTTTSPDVVYTKCSVAEVTDESGTCALEMDRFVLLGPKKRHVLTGPDFEAKHPDLASEVLTRDEGQTVEQVIIEETIVPDGVRGFVSGEAVLDDARGRSGGYRDGKRRFKLRGDENRPLIVSGWCQRRIVREFFRPVLSIVALAAVALVLAAAAVAIPLYLRSRAGL